MRDMTESVNIARELRQSLTDATVAFLELSAATRDGSSFGSANGTFLCPEISKVETNGSSACSYAKRL